MKIMNQKLDFFGFNNYRGDRIKSAGNTSEMIGDLPGSAHTAFFDKTEYWQVTPEVLYWGPKFFYERYKLPVIVTENGMSNIEWVSLDGKVHDPQRIDYLNRYLNELEKAINDGVDVKGYFVWSIMDNFEWAEAYKQRFGLVFVDYVTGKRTMKDSAYWYKQVISSNGGSLKSD
jgi:beta-glucosidase